jgi:hypothetical protein
VVANVLINEVDADSTGADTAEFVELFGLPGAALDGFCLIALNGSTDRVYLTVDLDGAKFNGSGFYVVGNAGVTNVGLTFTDNALQNGPDAVALVAVEDCSATITSSTTVTDVRQMTLVDAVVYETNDDDDIELLTLLNAGQSQVNEDGGGDSGTHTNARCPDGGGGARNSGSFVQVAPSPGSANDCAAFPTPTPTATSIGGNGPTATSTPTVLPTVTPDNRLITVTPTATVAAPTGNDVKLYLPVVQR